MKRDVTTYEPFFTTPTRQHLLKSRIEVCSDWHMIMVPEIQPFVTVVSSKLRLKPFPVKSSSALQREIPEEADVILRFHAFIVIRDKSVMHFSETRKWALPVFKNVVVPELKMVITYVPAVSHIIYPISQLVD
jgi:hypothetical protein